MNEAVEVVIYWIYWYPNCQMFQTFWSYHYPCAFGALACGQSLATALQ